MDGKCGRSNTTACDPGSSVTTIPVGYIIVDDPFIELEMLSWWTLVLKTRDQNGTIRIFQSCRLNTVGKQLSLKVSSYKLCFRGKNFQGQFCRKLKHRKLSLA